MRVAPTALSLGLAGLVLTSGLALADDAPKSSATSKTLFLAQEGCGTTAEPGRLEVKPQGDSADGCGTIGGLPLDEVFAQLGEASFDDYTSTSTMTPFLIDATKKIKGQLAAGSWVGEGVGAGTVTFDVHLTGTTTAGKGVDFGDTTVNGDATPGEDVAYVPFEMAVPASAKGATFKRFVLSVSMHGANLGMSAKKLSGDSYVVIPAKAPAKPVKRKK